MTCVGLKRVGGGPVSREQLSLGHVYTLQNSLHSPFLPAVKLLLEGTASMCSVAVGHPVTCSPVVHTAFTSSRFASVA